MTERFKKAYDSLVRAFFEGALAKGTCVACACGNIIFDAIGDPVTKEDLRLEMSITSNSPKTDYVDTVWSGKRVVDLRTFIFYALPEYENEVNAAGYTTAEFAQIENAFEAATVWPVLKYKELTEDIILEDQYRGLCAVVDVLMKLDNISQGAEEYKQKFREHPTLQAV